MSNPFEAPAAAVALPAPAVARPFVTLHVTPIWKVVILMFATLGYYELLWFWRNFRRGPGFGDGVVAALSTMFMIFTTHAMFRKIGALGARAGGYTSFVPGTLATLFVVCAVVGRVLGGLDAGVAILAVPVLAAARLWAMVAAQGEINRAREILDPGHARNDELGLGFLVALLCGSGLWLLGLIGVVAAVLEG